MIVEIEGKKYNSKLIPIVIQIDDVQELKEFHESFSEANKKYLFCPDGTSEEEAKKLLLKQ